MEISGDVLRFLSSCLLGAGLGFLYDGFRLLRLFWKNRAAVFVEDLFFSGICTLLTLWFLVEQCSGRVRAYALFGELLGFLVYHFTVGELVIRLLRGIVAVVKWVLHGIFRIFLRPIGQVIRFVAQKINVFFRWLLQCLKRAPILRNFHLQRRNGMLYNKHNKKPGRNKEGAGQDEGEKK